MGSRLSGFRCLGLWACAWACPPAAAAAVAASAPAPAAAAGLLQSPKGTRILTVLSFSRLISCPHWQRARAPQGSQTPQAVLTRACCCCCCCACSAASCWQRRPAGLWMARHRCVRPVTELCCCCYCCGPSGAHLKSSCPIAAAVHRPGPALALQHALVQTVKQSKGVEVLMGRVQSQLWSTCSRIAPAVCWFWLLGEPSRTLLIQEAFECEETKLNR